MRSITVAHARSRHSSTCAPVTPIADAHRSVGLRDVTVLVTGGNTGLTTPGSHASPTRSNPARHSLAHAPIAHVARAPAPATHSLPHAPQFNGSLCVETQRPAHALSPPSHTSALSDPSALSAPASRPPSAPLAPSPASARGPSYAPSVYTSPSRP
jgi:hypothetical protein